MCIIKEKKKTKIKINLYLNKVFIKTKMCGIIRNHAIIRNRLKYTFSFESGKYTNTVYTLAIL